MRIKALAIAAATATAGVLGVSGLANAAPAAPGPARTGISQQPELLQVRDGCGPGWYMARWQDRWGRWHWRCAPFRGWGPGPWSGGGWGPRWNPGWGGPWR
jgi:hypothetical protein